MTITTPLQVYPDPAVRAKAAGEGNVEDMFYLERRLMQLGADQGFPVLALGDQLQSVAEKNQLFLHGFDNTGMGTGHWNETGHRLAGQRLAVWIGELMESASR